ncbi:MAG TPA: 50S ribosome-binding GTPase [Phycisphaerae bacterium]|nr:50S ribosome-binding GTPase [Phycisphaerae bacterium]HRW52882.1 50S ribosome-binding GTPase [Phycisphaerae bacterium]
MNPDSSTYVALLTSPAPGAIAVIGVAGPGAESIVTSLCRSPAGRPIEQFHQDAPRFVRIHDAGRPLDDAVVTASAIGGTRRIEIGTHGGARIVQRVIQALSGAGATRISGMAFEDRFGGRSPIERDVDKALLSAGSRRLARWLVAQRTLLPTYFATFGGRSGEEIAEYDRRTRVGIRAVRGIRVALVGPPNAGKSTLANRLIGHRRVIVSSEAGTTRDWVDETAMIDGWPVTLTDTAGIRESPCEIELEAIRRGAAQARASDLALIVADATAAPDERRGAIRATLDAIQGAAPTMIVLNKTDAAPTADDVSGVSALTGDGIEAFEREVVRLLGLDQLCSTEATGFLPAHLDGRPETNVERFPT